MRCFMYKSFQILNLKLTIQISGVSTPNWQKLQQIPVLFLSFPNLESF
jgi:hypothetical protein